VGGVKKRNSLKKPTSAFASGQKNGCVQKKKRDLESKLLNRRGWKGNGEKVKRNQAKKKKTRPVDNSGGS